ncbi:Uu.00g133670.m01.CDS01 [Anthostomella pinea]|uniref:Uu.00g133670.m01.CDS01 n=1 Tax=Anthostomella pinea TaxID=933095 RepID=A0AAI8YKM3_9PEZI|nr:Uu.00g133670.m01.CDS01 [Anthostomella pinea]
MAEVDSATLTEPDVPAKGYVQSFPAPGLRQIFRHITGHDGKGDSVFLRSDQGDHHRIMGDQQAVANILYSTQETPAELNGDVDIEKASSQEPPLHYHGGSIVRMIDFAPNVESPLHRAVSIDYGIVVEGVFELILDSGEKRVMRQGDVSVQRATAHKWKNISGNGTMPGRIMWVLLDCKDVYVNGNKMEGFLGDLAKEYVDQGVSK